MNWPSAIFIAPASRPCCARSWQGSAATSDALLDYEAICQQLKPTTGRVDRGLAEIPLSKIVGSVGRYQDFTSEFLPKKSSDEVRWAQVKAAMTDMAGLPPIEVYQIGDAYFVSDGNHRVSVARKLGIETISAYITEVKTRVPLSATDNPEEVICKARYANFLAITDLDQEVPDIDLLMTMAGHYQLLIDQIERQYERMSNESGGADFTPTRAEAALAWYQSVYLPVVTIIRELGVMRRFPKRTETDIYVLLSERREELERALGWHLELEQALPTLVQTEASAQVAPKPNRFLPKFLDTVRAELADDMEVGAWRTQQLAMHREGRLFSDLLVLFEDINEDWDLLEAAVELAVADHDRILGLCIVDKPTQFDRSYIREMAARFKRRCQSAGLVGEFALESGDGATTLLKRAAWADLVFINLTHPPGSTLRDRLRSFWGPVITRCPRPLLVAPHARFNGMDSMLLAYDGSPKANEALFVATYHASRWGTELAVLTVETAYTRPDALANAKRYLEEHDVNHADYLLREAPIGKAIMEVAASYGSKVICMGGFGASPAMRLLRGSSVEYVLQHTVDQSVLICQ